MTISVENNKNVYTADDITKTFYFTFKIYNTSDLSVTTESNGISTSYLLDTDYTVSGTGVNTGGSVTFTTAPTDGHSVILIGDYDYTQSTVYVPGSNFPAAAHERALDKLMSLSLKHKEILDRSLRFGDTHIDGHVKVAAPVTSQYLRWGTDELGSARIDSVDLPTDHGALTGLSDDDHTQYHTDTRGDIRYFTQSQVSALVTAASGTTDHGALTGRDDDDHTQYHNDTRGDIRYYLKGTVDDTFTSHIDVSSTDHDNRYYTETETDTLLDTLSGTLSASSGQTRYGEHTIASGVTNTFVSFDTEQDDTTYYINVNVKNVVDTPPSLYSYVITSTTTSGFDVLFSGTIDSNNYSLCWSLHRDEYVAPARSWVEKHDNTYWSAYAGTWNSGSQIWEPDHPAGYYLAMNAIGDWAAGYRPTKVRVTFTESFVGSANIWLRDASDNIIVESNGTSSVQEIDCSFVTAGDIAKFQMTQLDDQFDFDVSKIEFYAFS